MYKSKCKSSHCCSPLTINYKYFFSNNQCSLVVFASALFLPLYLINLIPMKYWKQQMFSIIVTISAFEGYSTYHYWHSSHIILIFLQCHYRRWHKLAVIKQMPPHISLQSSMHCHTHFCKELGWCSGWVWTHSLQGWVVQSWVKITRS